jgi:hypothetical protein
VDISVPYLRTQSELLTEVKAKTRLGATARWDDDQYYYALNEVLYTWADYVKLPRIYTITGGFTASNYEYDLPVYIRPPLFPQLERRIPYYEYEIESKLLFDQWRSYMAAYFIQDGGTHEISRYEKALGYYDQQAMNYFATYRPRTKQNKVSLSRKVFALR